MGIKFVKFAAAVGDRLGGGTGAVPSRMEVAGGAAEVEVERTVGDTEAIGD